MEEFKKILEGIQKSVESLEKRVDSIQKAGEVSASGAKSPGDRSLPLPACDIGRGRSLSFRFMGR